MKRSLITELPAREINRHQVEGGDIMVLPVATVEVLGPHLPVGGRMYVADAFATLIAQAVGGMRLPVLAPGPVQGTGRMAGSIDVEEGPLHALVRGVMDDLWQTGWRRILLVTYLDYARYYLPQELYEDRNVAAAGMHLSEMLGGELSARGLGEDSIVVGALRVLGREDLVAKCEEAYARWKKSGKKPAALPEAFAALKKAGCVGVEYPKGYYPLWPGKKLDAEAGAEVLRNAAAERAPALESLRAYNEYLSRRNSRGFLKGNWFRE